MNSSRPAVSPPVQVTVLAIALIVVIALGMQIIDIGTRKVLLFGVGLFMGVALYHASFGFTGAYRRAIRDGDITGVSAQLVMLAVAMVLFAPVLAKGNVFGQWVGGALAPVSVSMAFGAFIFGIGMQLAGGCASGTLFSAGGGNVRMILVLLFFIAGSFWGSLDLYWWSQLPSIGAVSLAQKFGWPMALALQLAILAAVYLGLRLAGGRNHGNLWGEGRPSWQRVFRGSWPLMASGMVLALLNFATLLIAGHPWSITWAFSLWPAKIVSALGWDLSTNPFWGGDFQQAALSSPVLADTTSVMDIAIMLGALIAASLAGRAGGLRRLPLASLVPIIIGGLMMGYGARLAYGCNIGAFFSGVASTSLHGWVWILLAVPGNMIGVRLRPVFGLD